LRFIANAPVLTNLFITLDLCCYILNPLPYQNAERLAVRKKREAHGEDLRAHGDNYTPLHAEAREQLTWT
jgi:hypothetical protein